MNYFVNILSVSVCLLGSLAYCQFAPTSVQIKTTNKDNTPRVVDLAALRQMAIDAYLNGSPPSEPDLGGVSVNNLTIGLICGIIVWSVLMIIISHQCQKHLLKDFYKLQMQN